MPTICAGILTRIQEMAFIILVPIGLAIALPMLPRVYAEHGILMGRFVLAHFGAFLLAWFFEVYRLIDEGRLA